MGPHFIVPADYLKTLTSSERLDYALQLVRKFVPPDFGTGWASRLLNIARSGITALRNYAPRPYPFQITLFSAGEDFDASTSQGSASPWEHLAPGRVNTLRIHCKHEAMMAPPNVKTIAQLLEKHIAIGEQSCSNQHDRPSANVSE